LFLTKSQMGSFLQITTAPNPGFVPQISGTGESLRPLRNGLASFLKFWRVAKVTGRPRNGLASFLLVRASLGSFLQMYWLCANLASFLKYLGQAEAIGFCGMVWLRSSRSSQLGSFLQNTRRAQAWLRSSNTWGRRKLLAFAEWFGFVPSRSSQLGFVFHSYSEPFGRAARAPGFGTI
jgi:hypothetical protein